jgi:hypothetical protein
MLTPDTLYEGYDCSNWDGELSHDDVASMWAEGKRFLVVRLSFETPEKLAISRQQIAAAQSVGLFVVGYDWAYWWEFATTAALRAASLAKAYGIRCVVLDAETDVVPGIDPVIWMQAWTVTMHGEGIIPVMYSDPGWWQSNNLDLTPLGDIRWWVAQWNGRRDLNVTLPYVGARVIGHQYADTSPGTRVNYDSDVMTFDSDMLGGSTVEPAAPLTEADVRAIVRDELAGAMNDAGQGESLSGWVKAVDARLNAAGHALDLDEAAPPSFLATRAASGEQVGPAAAYPTA